MGYHAASRASAATLSCLLAAILFPLSAHAQPGAGVILQIQPKPPAPPVAPPVQITPAMPEQAAPSKGPKILVKGFRIKGAVLIPESELQAQLKGAIGHELTLEQIRATAMLITLYYSEKGYLARVILPPQEIRDGIVELHVIEGRRGSLNVDRIGARIDIARIRDFIERRVPAGEPLNLAELGEALNILNEQPGISARASLVPGSHEGEIGIDVKATAQPLLRYTVGLNNQGAHGTGEAQASGSITLVNPTGHFDAASLLYNKSQGTDYARADYSLAAGDSGLRLGVNASHLRYQLITAQFAALQSNGTADGAGASASYPLARRTDFNLSLTGSYEDTKLVDKTVAGETSNRVLDVFDAGLSGYALRWGGVESFGADLVSGNSNQHNAAALAADSITRRVQGQFGKLGYNFGWLSSLTKSWNLNATLHGQFADKNLDSYQQIILGGPNGVRAYPVGEGIGDQGWIANLDLSRSFAQSLTGHLFYDAGTVMQNHSLWANWNAANPNLPNIYTLMGVGAGIDWRINPFCLLTASIANPLGNNPGADINHLNVDGYGNHARAWLAFNANF